MCLGSQLSSTPSEASPRTTLSSYSYPHALHIPLAALLPYYSTLILTYGASLSNPLSSVAGSSSSESPLQGVFPALAFVSWYNGHPAFLDLPVDLSEVREVAIVGQGNVALDVARILLKGSKGQLGDTDMPEQVLHVLSKRKVERVRAVGRRGPGQVAFTTKEFREMINLPDVKYTGIQGDILEQAKEQIGNDRMRKRLLGLMEKSNGSTGSQRFSLDFLRGPKAFIGEAGRVKEVEWDINELLSPPSMPSPPESQRSSVALPTVTARSTGQTVRTKADMVIESVGYRSEPLLGDGWALPFDTARGKIRNVGGRVADEDSVPVSHSPGPRVQISPLGRKRTN